MKNLCPLFFLILFFILTAALGADEIDLLLGVNVDVAPFGIESIIPGAVVYYWPWNDHVISPGADLAFFGWTDRIEFSSHLYLRAGCHDTLSLTAGAGALYMQGDYFGHNLAGFYPEVLAGLRLNLPGMPVIYGLVSVRFKERDTDKNLLALAGINR